MIYGLNASFEKVQTYVDFIEAEYIERYNNFSEYILYIEASEYNEDVKYIYNTDSDYIGIVNQETIEELLNGRFIAYRGYTLEYILENEIFYPAFTFKGTLEAAIKKIYNDYFKASYTWDLVISEEAKSINVDLNYTGDNIGTALYELLNNYEMGYKLNYDYLTNKFKLIVYKGLDRGYTQEVNEPVLFSTNRNNISSLSITTDDSNYKNYAVVRYQKQDESYITGIADLSAGETKKKIYIEDTELENPTEAQLIEAGKSILKNDYASIENIECKLQLSGYKYKENFNLGDLVELQIVSLKKSYEVRIIEVSRTYRSNNVEYALTLGNVKPSIYKKIRSVRK